jgi:hypothetical protein
MLVAYLERLVCLLLAGNDSPKQVNSLCHHVSTLLPSIISYQEEPNKPFLFSNI